MLLPLVALLSLSAPTDSLPTATPTVPNSPPAASTPGPLVPGSWGLGFRALGSSYDILLRKALTDRTSLGVQVRWYGTRNEDHFESSSESVDLDYDYTSSNEVRSWGDETYARGNVSLGLPYEILTQAPGSVRMSLALGPVFRYSLNDVESTSEQRIPSQVDGSIARTESSHSEDRAFGGGLEGSMGVRWFVQPGLAIAADFAASALWMHGTRTLDGSAYPYPGYHSSGATRHDYDDVFTSSAFVGFGLEAWF